MAREISCPACHIDMLAIKRYEVEIDSCHRCSGIWFDAKELLHYAAGRRKLELESNPPQGTFYPDKREWPLTCPNCQDRTYETGNTSGLPMGRCTACHGVYVPAQTLKAIFPDAPNIESPLRIKTKTDSKPDFAELFLSGVVDGGIGLIVEIIAGGW